MSTCIILDGPAIVNMLKPNGVTTFQEYLTQVFIPYVMLQISHADSLDIVWDIYVKNSLELTARI